MLYKYLWSEEVNRWVNNKSGSCRYWQATASRDNVDCVEGSERPIEGWRSVQAYEGGRPQTGRSWGCQIRRLIPSSGTCKDLHCWREVSILGSSWFSEYPRCCWASTLLPSLGQRVLWMSEQNRSPVQLRWGLEWRAGALQAGLASRSEALCDGREAANPWPRDRSTICTLGAGILQLPQPTQADLTQLSA